MSNLTAKQVYTLALNTGVSSEHALVLTVIAYFESGWNPNNLGDQHLAKFGSRGLWQIFTGAHTPNEVLGHGGNKWSTTLANALYHPSTNAHAMHVVFEEQGFQAWSTYNNLNGTPEWDAKYAEVKAAVQ